jgi:phenylpropionate dioxygenase-like ring-hydroxylating dioxygenase large terminal subunit
LPANWKLAQEAFMEAYHTPVAHPEMTHVVGDWNMQHDVFGDHVSRDLCLMATPSPASKLGLSEQDLLDRMLKGDPEIVGSRITVPEGKSAREIMAQELRATLGKEFGIDCTIYTDAEMIDSIKYNLFPNIFIYAGVGFRQIQQFRPLGNDPDRCLYDHIVFRPVPKTGERPPPATPFHLGEDDSYSLVPGLDPFGASVLDQDTGIMRLQREGMYASEKGAETLSRYQESRIRAFEDTLEKYINAE